MADLYRAIHIVCMGSMSDKIWRCNFIVRPTNEIGHISSTKICVDHVQPLIHSACANFVLYLVSLVFLWFICFAILVTNWPDIMGPITVITPLRDSWGREPFIIQPATPGLWVQITQRGICDMALTGTDSSMENCDNYHAMVMQITQSKVNPLM